MAPTVDPLSPDSLARVRAGERDAFEPLFRAWYPRLAEYAARLLGNRDAAEDAVQDVFVAVWSRHASLPEASKLAAYLHRAVRNRALNQLRHQRTAGRWLAQVEADPAVAAVAESSLEHAELEGALRAALANLSPRAREVFQLSRDQGLTYPEIADTLGISVKTVETLMSRALRALRSRLAARLESG